MPDLLCPPRLASLPQSGKACHRASALRQRQLLTQILVAAGRWPEAVLDALAYVEDEAEQPTQKLLRRRA